MLPKKQLLVLLSFMIVTVSQVAFAESETVTATVQFASPISIVKHNDIDFGVVESDTLGTILINTNNIVTSGDIDLIGGTPKAGDFTVTGSLSQTLIINALNYTTDNGVTVGNATCSYGGLNLELPCNNLNVGAAGLGANLRVGASLTIDGTQAAGESAAPTFDLVLLYL